MVRQDGPDVNAAGVTSGGGEGHLGGDPEPGTLSRWESLADGEDDWGDDGPVGGEGGGAPDPHAGWGEGAAWFGQQIQTAAEPLVARWRVAALGRHPLQHAARDLLLGSLLRDPRVKWFHRLTADPPAWLSDRVDHLPQPQRVQALQLLAYQALHQHALERWLRDEPGEPGEPAWAAGDRRRNLALINYVTDCVRKKFGDRFSDDCHPLDYHADVDEGTRDRVLREAAAGGEERSRLLGRMQACRPGGAVFEWAGDGPPPPRSTCGNARTCPWCYARRVEDLYHRLHQGPLQAPGPDTHLALLRMVIPSVDLRPDPDAVALMRARYFDRFDQYAWDVYLYFPRSLPELVLATLPRREFSPHQVLPRGQAERIRERVGGWLRDRAVALGARGGLVTHEVGSYRDAVGGRLGFAHTVTALFAVEVPRGGGLDFVRRAGAEVSINDVPTTPACVLLPAGHPQALRFALFGTSYTYPAGRAGVVGNRVAGGTMLTRGVTGAFLAPPTFLMNFDQWASYTREMKGHPLYRLFGTWSADARAGEERKRRRAEYRKWPQNRRRERVTERSRLAALARVNAAKSARSQEELQRLLPLAKPVWDRARESGQRVGWSRLRSLLARDGVEVSESWARRLVRELGGAPADGG